MHGSIKVIVVGLGAIGLTAGGAAYALTATSSTEHRTQVGAPAITTPVTVVDPQDPESVTPTTTTAPPPTGPTKEEITAAQQQLFDSGYWLSAVDGLYGSSTQQALMAFQKIKGLKRTGQLDDTTKAALASIERPAPSSTSGDLIEVDKTRQVIFIVRDGKTLWVLNTSTGTEKSYVTDGNKGFAHTPTGTFKVLRFVDAVDPGPLGPLYRPRYFTNTGIAIHGAAAIPSYPASHGCARVSNAAMDYIWAQDLMPVGSLVWVYEDPAKQPFAPPSTTTTTVPTTTSTTAATTSSTSSSSSTTSTTAAHSATQH